QARRDAAELEQGAQYPDDEPPAVDTPFGPSPAGASPIRGGQS
ncbi:MAG: hypothetical protein JWQ77_4072, partial [Jatrophihabitans sp.]|nr:hypothetical protein [Jatrophihabitans sp.]